MNSDLITLITATRQKVLNIIMLVEASLSRITPYDVNQNYTPEEMEPYDAMSDRFIRAVEVSLKFFRTYERYLFAESSDTIRDLLNRMATVDLITSTQLWVAMRDVRNRIVHDYLPTRCQANLRFYPESVWQRIETTSIQTDRSFNRLRLKIDN